jgi:serine/threonine-protein kinase
MSGPEIIASRYRVVRELGRGGMGVVYVVEHTRTGDQVALKLLHGAAAEDPHSIERFKREARASARIKSDHVVKVIDADVAPERENAPFLVMELLNGADLKHEVETAGKLPADKVLEYLGQAARALDKSHSIGIVHRDLKPENLFIHRREDGTTVLKILDFGISKIVAGEAPSDMTGAGITSTGSVMGTPLYMAPEQARGRVNEIGATTDVWAMGLIAISLLTGEIYWPANTVAELMAQILSDPMYPPTQRWSWLPPGIDSWFARSCARDPKERFTSVGQQVKALAAALNLAPSSDPAIAVAGQTPVLSVTPPTVPSLSGVATTGAISSDRRATTATATRMPLMAAAAVALIAVAGTSAWVLKGRSAAPPPPTDTLPPPKAEPAPVVTAASPPPVAPAGSSAPVGLAPLATQQAHAESESPSATAAAAAAASHAAGAAAAHAAPAAHKTTSSAPPAAPAAPHTAAAAPAAPTGAFNPAAP